MYQEIDFKKLSKTKKAQYNALLQRVTDIAFGAGVEMDGEDGWISVDMLPNLIIALERRLNFSKVEEWMMEPRTLFASHNLDNFENVDKLAKYLFQYGVRA